MLEFCNPINGLASSLEIGMTVYSSVERFTLAVAVKDCDEALQQTNGVRFS